MIELKSISMRYKNNDFNSLNNINININKGKITALIGPNGAGKTTLIKIISGILKPTNYSNINIFGTNPYVNKKEKNKIGLILNSNQLYEDLTAFENLMFYMKLNKVKKSKEEIQKALANVGLNGKENILVKNFSTGMKQKLSIAKVLLIDCELLILDEPTSGMDPVSKSEIYQLLKQVNNEYHTSIIISSHVMNEVEKISDDVIFLNRGEIAYQGSLLILKSEFANKVSEIYCNNENSNLLFKYIKENNFKFFHQNVLDNHKFVIFSEIDFVEQTFDRITIRSTELEDIFFYYVLGAK